MAIQMMQLENPLRAKQPSGIYQGPTFIGSAYGPSVPSGWGWFGASDFNGDGHPDYVLYNAATRQTAIWYLNNNVYSSGSAYGPTVPAGWSLGCRLV